MEYRSPLYSDVLPRRRKLRRKARKSEKYFSLAPVLLRVRVPSTLHATLPMSLPLVRQSIPYILRVFIPSTACRTLNSAQALTDGIPDAKYISLDVNNTSDLEAQVAAHDLVISLIPYTYHSTVIKAAIKAKVHVVTTSYVSPAMLELDEEAKKAGIVVMNEIGLDPGIDHLYAVKTIDEVHAKGGKVSLWFCQFNSTDGPYMYS
jgi:hypothetical protein